jgi:tRNA dimethylallyltransferase
MEKEPELLVHPHTIVSVLGPTAVGKTKLAIHIAKQLNTEIISADSRQFYSEISIGTAKPSLEELQQVTHHFIGNISVAQTYTAGDFERDAIALSSSLFNQHKQIVLCGGSGLYVKAFIEGLDELPRGDDELRKSLRKSFENYGINYLQQELRLLNPSALEVIDVNNPQRLMRAIEIAKSTPIHGVDNKKARNFNHLPIGLDMPREELYEKINSRVDLMIEMGLLAEVQTMLPYRQTYAMKTVGYAELFDYLDGKLTLNEAINLIKQHTRNYAKKQLTWFKKVPGIKWFHPDDFESICDYINLKLGFG